MHTKWTDFDCNKLFRKRERGACPACPRQGLRWESVSGVPSLWMTCIYLSPEISTSIVENKKIYLSTKCKQYGGSTRKLLAEVLTVARRRLAGGLPSSVSGTILLAGACKPLAYGTRLWLYFFLATVPRSNPWTDFNRLWLKWRKDVPFEG